MARKGHTKHPRRRLHLATCGEVEVRVDKVARDNQSDHKDRSKDISVVEVGNIAPNEPDIEDENPEIG